MRTRSKQIMVILLALLFIAPAMAGEQLRKVQGEVLAVENAGEFDRLQIRTRSGEMVQVNLGEAGSCQGTVAAGDQVRLRLMSGGQVDGSYQARTMKNQGTGESYQFRTQSGEMVQAQDRLQTRTRLQNGSGTGTGAQTRTRSGGGGGSGSGGGGRGGGR